GLVRQHREGPAGARMAAEVQQRAGAAAQLRLVSRESRSLRRPERHLASRALETGCAGTREAALLIVSLPLPMYSRYIPSGTESEFSRTSQRRLRSSVR